MTNFIATCSRLSHYLKEQQRLASVARSTTIMNLLPGLDVSAETGGVALVRQPLDLFPQHADLSAASVPAEEKAQLTIIYGGQMLVFHDFPADKANDLMLIVGKGSSIDPPTSVSADDLLLMGRNRNSIDPPTSVSAEDLLLMVGNRSSIDPPTSVSADNLMLMVGKGSSIDPPMLMVGKGSSIDPPTSVSDDDLMLMVGNGSTIDPPTLMIGKGSSIEPPTSVSANDLMLMVGKGSSIDPPTSDDLMLMVGKGSSIDPPTSDAAVAGQTLRRGASLQRFMEKRRQRFQTSKKPYQTVTSLSAAVANSSSKKPVAGLPWFLQSSQSNQAHRDADE